MPAFRIYRDNRTVPVVISIITVCLIYMLLDPSARQVRELQREQAARAAANVGAWPSRPQDHLGSKSAGSHEGAGEGVPSLERLDADDVLLILKTGATVLWKRLPVHLTTTLSSDRIPPDNTVIYSDNEVTIGNHTTVDILAGLPPAVRASPAFETYRAARDWDANNVYAEHAGLPGDGDDGLGPPGGWPLDKYKFLPLVQHAGNRWPAAKWYLYTEDDTYLFLPNVLRHLARYDHRAAHWLGGLGEKLDTTFAHGGSGFALSRGAWERSFGRGGDLTTKYQAMVDAACCGDYALGRVLNDYGVRFGEHGGDEAWSWGWNGLPHWKIEFSRDNWCQPVLTWHHAHSRDIARYHELERSWDFSSVSRGEWIPRPIPSHSIQGGARETTSSSQRERG